MLDSIAITRTDLILEKSRALRFFIVFILYVAQGVPIGLFWFAIPAWMAANGADAKAVAYVLGLTALPWSLKLVNGFIMDRYSFLQMGRRRIWLIGAQSVMILCLLACATLEPGVGDLVLLGATGFIVNMATTFQDVAVDGMAVDIMPEDERARASGMMFGGQSFGIAVATAATGAAIAAYGPSAAYLIAALFIGMVTALMLFVRERQGERLLPWSEGEVHPRNLAIHVGAWVPILKATWRSMLRPMSLIWLPILLVKGTIYGLYTGGIPIIATGEAGWSETDVTSLTSISQLIAAAIGLTFGGWFTDRIGAKKAVVIFLALWAAYNLTMGLASPWWGQSRFVSAVILSWVTMDILITIAAMPICMRLSSPSVAATQFTLYMATNNFGISLGAALLGASASIGGLPMPFILMAGLFAVAAAVTARVNWPEKQIEDKVAPALAVSGGPQPQLD